MSKYFRNNFTNVNSVLQIVRIFYLDEIEYYWKYSVKVYSPRSFLIYINMMLSILNFKVMH